MEKDEEEEEIEAIVRKARMRSKSAASIPNNLLMTNLKSKSTVTVHLKVNNPPEIVSNDSPTRPIGLRENILDALTTEERNLEDEDKKFAAQVLTRVDKSIATNLDQITILEEHVR